MSRRSKHSKDSILIAGLYDIGDIIGEGQFAVVRKAKHVITGEIVAVKIISRNKMSASELETLQEEVQCLQAVQHPYVVRMLDVFETPTKLYIIMEYADGGDLTDVLSSRRILSQPFTKRYFSQVMQAITYCHHLRVVHRDLKPGNILLFTLDDTAKVCDFGLSKRFAFGDLLRTSCGSVSFSAPEMFKGEPYDPPAVDIWSLGVILYVLVFGKLPFAGFDDNDTLTRILDCKYKFPTKPIEVTDDCKKLISSMLVRDPRARITAKEILSHVWLKDTVGDLLTASGHAIVKSPSNLSTFFYTKGLTEKDHDQIVRSIIERKVASHPEIIEAIESRKYNHIAATYFLLTEKLRREREPTRTPDQKQWRRKFEDVATKSDSAIRIKLRGHKPSVIIEENPVLHRSESTAVAPLFTQRRSIVESQSLTAALPNQAGSKFQSLSRKKNDLHLQPMDALTEDRTPVPGAGGSPVTPPPSKGKTKTSAKKKHAKKTKKSSKVSVARQGADRLSITSSKSNKSNISNKSNKSNKSHKSDKKNCCIV